LGYNSPESSVSWFEPMRLRRSHNRQQPGEKVGLSSSANINSRATVDIGAVIAIARLIIIYLSRVRSMVDNLTAVDFRIIRRTVNHRTTGSCSRRDGRAAVSRNKHVQNSDEDSCRGEGSGYYRNSFHRHSRLSFCHLWDLTWAEHNWPAT
jgi:hypothetical protein